jgi:putative transposase
VNEPETTEELEALRRATRRGCPFGDEAWTRAAARQLGAESALRPLGRPRKADPPTIGS